MKKGGEEGFFAKANMATVVLKDKVASFLQESPLL